MILICNHCNKEFESFRKDKKCCTNLCRERLRYKTDREHILERTKQHWEKNRDIMNKKRAEYILKNKDKQQKWIKNANGKKTRGSNRSWSSTNSCR